MSKIGGNKILFLILLTAAFLHLWSLGSGDILGDEVLYSFRAIGMLDFDNAEFQTTPLQWWDPNVPSWVGLSFHDHPPLVFLTQNFFMNIFGESSWAFRLPSAILGTVSAYLLYLIGRRLFNRNCGLIAAALFAATVNHVFISRMGLQESYVIFFILLTTLFFLKSLENKKYFIWLGVAVGLGVLTKYTIVIAPITFATYLLLFRRDFLKSKFLWLGVALSMLIFSPVIIYNIQLYRSVGHFDFQLSYIFSQNPEVWKTAPGKEEIGTITDRLRNFLPNLFNSNSWPLLIIFTVSLFFLRQRFLIIALVATAGLFLIIGPTTRFLTMLTPWIVLSLASMLTKISRRWLIGAVLVFEILYSVNSQVFNYPLGRSPWLYSKVRNENYHWGYNKLDSYLEKELAGQYPALAFEMRYHFLKEVQDLELENAAKSGLKPRPAMIVYDGNFLSAPAQWIFDRRQIYHGWPVMKAADYRKIIAENGTEYFSRAGIGEIYFAAVTANTPLNKKGLTDDGVLLEQEFLMKGIFPEAVYNEREEAVFRIYKITI